jgi:hypothetical protein
MISNFESRTQSWRCNQCVITRRCTHATVGLLAHLVLVRPHIRIEVGVSGPKRMTRRLWVVSPTYCIIGAHRIAMLRRRKSHMRPKHGRQIGGVQALSYTSGGYPDEQAVDILPPLGEGQGCLQA